MLAVNLVQIVASSKPIVVLGDLMLDIYVFGSVGRISPEAPVPVVRYASEVERAGGAANVAHNIAAIGGKVHLIGAVGCDTDAERLERVVTSYGICADLVRCASCPTVTKTRILSGKHHQFLRIDREGSAPLPSKTEAELLGLLDRALEGAGALILSDYAKGCLSDRVLAAAIDRGRRCGVPVLVDPKRSDFTAYAGADFIKPNLAELAAASGVPCDTEAAIERAARRLIDQTGANLLLTMSERGMGMFHADGTMPLLMPTVARDVYDVSGAGDTVIAVFSLLLSTGASLRQAMHVANVAAGIVVSKPGTATASLDELARALEDKAKSDTPGSETLLLGWDAARALCDRWRDSGQRVGFTNGCFDLLHPGHIRILQGARRTCDKLIVGLNSDSSIVRLKGNGRPVQSEAARAEVIGALGCVDAVVLFEQDTPFELIRCLEPDVLIKGADYAEDQIVGADLVRARGGRIERIPLKDGHSTTRLIEKAFSGGPTAVSIAEPL